MDRFELQKMVAFQPDKMAKVDVIKSKQMLCGLNCFEPGQVQKVHAHAGADKLYYVVEGRGEFEVGEEKQELAAGELLYVPEDVPHGVANTSATNLVVLIVIAPNLLG
jgi:quercetin dioxygenase-like cupin family protein